MNAYRVLALYIPLHFEACITEPIIIDTEIIFTENEDQALKFFNEKYELQEKYNDGWSIYLYSNDPKQNILGGGDRKLIIFEEE